MVAFGEKPLPKLRLPVPNAPFYSAQNRQAHPFQVAPPGTLTVSRENPG